MKNKINKFIVTLTLFLIGGLVSTEIKAQTQRAVWVKWYNGSQQNEKYIGTAKEIANILYFIRAGKVRPGKVYEFPDPSTTGFSVAHPNELFESWLKSYQEIDSNVTRENLPETMVKDDNLIWDNNFASVKVNNLYYSEVKKSVQEIPDYSGLSAQVPVIGHNGKLVGKRDCVNPFKQIQNPKKFEGGVTPKKEIKATSEPENFSNFQFDDQTQSEECWEYKWTEEIVGYTTETQKVVRYASYGENTGYLGNRYTTQITRRVPIIRKKISRVRCGQTDILPYIAEDDIPLDNSGAPKRSYCEDHPFACWFFRNVQGNIRVRVYSNGNPNNGNIVRYEYIPQQVQQTGQPSHVGGRGNQEDPVHTGGSGGSTGGNSTHVGGRGG